MKKIISVICIILVLVSMTSSVSAAKKDTKAPVIEKTYPVDKATDVMVESTLIIRFSENLRKGKAIAKISLKEADTKTIAFTYEMVDDLIKIMPKEKLKYNTLYTLVIPVSAVKDAAGNNFAKAYTFNFITEEDPAAIADEETKEGTKYIIEIEANLESKLTNIEIIFFTQLLKNFGIDASFKDMYEVDKEETLEEDISEEEKDAP